jgi:hypothetical protein
MSADIDRLLEEASAIKERMGLSVPVDIVATYMAMYVMFAEVASKLPASSGYEPLLVEAGWNRLAARGMAALLRRHGRRRARESKWHRPVFDAIRFLAQSQRQVRAILPRAKLILYAWKETSIIETLFDEAGLRDTTFEFINLLESAVNRRDVDRKRITEIAASVLPFVSINRGPKITAPSAAYEFCVGGPEGLGW